MAESPGSLYQWGAELLFDLREGGREGPGVAQGRPAKVVDEQGRLPVGALGVVADLALGLPALSIIGPEAQLTTSHVHMEVIRPPSIRDDRVRGEGTLVARTSGSAFVAASLYGADDVVLASVTGRFAILPVDGDNGGPIRPASGDPVAPRPSAVGRPLTSAPIHRTLGARLVETAPGAVTMTVAAHERLSNERGGLHGGVGILLGEQVNSLAARSAVGGDGDVTVVELRVAYLRPILVEDQAIECRAQVQHRGRTVIAVRGEVCGPDGRLAIAVESLHLRSR